MITDDQNAKSYDRVSILTASNSSTVLAGKLQQTIETISPEIEVTIQSSDNIELSERTWFCPLLLDLPPSLPFAGRTTYQRCQDWQTLRQTVAEWGYAVGDGHYWLPIVLTAKGPLYAEAIARDSSHFYQPWHLNDATRQTLYRLGYRLLQAIAAIPGVYLLQFGEGEPLCFDRIIPFPDEPALASIGVQEPDLLMSYWYCQMGTPIRDLQIQQQPSSNA